MSKSKWRVLHQKKTGLPVVKNEADETVCIFPFTGKDSTINNESAAKLIAAAPSMKELLEDITTYDELPKSLCRKIETLLRKVQ